MAQRTKRCHWVPQSYLRAFAADENKTKIWRLGKLHAVPELKSIEKVAVKFYLYVPRNENGLTDDAFEKQLASIEDWFSDSVWQSIQTDFIDLSWKPLRMMLSLSIAIMYLRNPTQLDMLRIIRDEIRAVFQIKSELPDYINLDGKKLYLDHSDWHVFQNSGEDDLKREWIREMRSAAHYAEALMKMRWSMLVADNPVFVTTDNPVVFLHPSLSFRGINNPDTVMIFPVSPKRILFIDNKMEEPHNQYYPLTTSPGAQNTLMWRFAIDHMFCSDQPDIFCREIAAEFDRWNSS